MGKRARRDRGPNQHGEGMHGARTHQRFVEMLTEGRTEDPEPVKAAPEGHQRLHEDREQHDEAEKNSEKVRAMREVQRGNVDENVLGHARIPHEGDSD